MRRRVVLIGAERCPTARAVVRAVARRQVIEAVEVAADQWGVTIRPWLTLSDGRFRAGWLEGTREVELTAADRLWVIAEDPLPRQGADGPEGAGDDADYLRAEWLAARQGWHGACPASTVNRRGLRAPAFTYAPWQLAGRTSERHTALRSPRLALGAPPTDARWVEWPASRRGAERLWWQPADGALHVAVVAGGEVTLCRWAPHGVEAAVDAAPALTAALLAFAARCDAQYLEVWLAVPAAGDGPATVLDVNPEPAAFERLTGAAGVAAGCHLSRFVGRWLDDAAGADGAIR